MSVFDYTAKKLFISSWIWIAPRESSSKNTFPAKLFKTKPTLNPLGSARQWLDQIEVDNPKQAHYLCRLIPSQCPFERDIKLFGHTLLHIPPLCKLNPLYEETVALRFRAMCYLADECGEDISAYC
ncbi:MAG: nitrogenase [Symploca sp. SIO2E6]|nr:nitrogenase [Symploca sp. SIO2E6]